MALDVALERLDAVTAVLSLSGPLSLGINLKILDTQLQQLVSEGVVQIILDLSACPYADSAGLGVLVHTYGLVNAKGGLVRLCGASDRVATLLKLTHTDALLPCDPDVAASKAAFSYH